MTMFKNNNTEKEAKSKVYYDQLAMMIKDENYDSKEDFERVLNKYLDKQRITREEYDKLYDQLYPPVYDIKNDYVRLTK